MALFGQSQKGQRGFDWSAAALTFLGAGPIVQQRRQRELEAQRIAVAQQAAMTASDQSRMFQEGLGQLGYTKPQIQVFAAHPESATALLQSRLAPHSESPGERFTLPGVGGPDQVSTAPTTDEQQTAFFNRLHPGMGDAFARRQAYGPPIPTTDGGGVMGYNDSGVPTWLMRPAALGPDTATPAPPQRAPGPVPNTPRANYGNPVAELSTMLGVPPSSGYRTQAHQNALIAQGLTHTRHSSHTDRDGLDFPIPAGPAQQSAAARIRQRYPSARFAFENSNLHVTLPGWGQAPDLTNSAARYPNATAGEPRNLPVANTAADAARFAPGTEFMYHGQRRVRH